VLSTLLPCPGLILPSALELFLITALVPCKDTEFFRVGDAGAGNALGSPSPD
jgi:hypothetical protein